LIENEIEKVAKIINNGSNSSLALTGYDENLLKDVVVNLPAECEKTVVPVSEVFQIENSNIPIDSVREIEDFFKYRPEKSKRKYVLLLGADAMSYRLLPLRDRLLTKRSFWLQTRLLACHRHNGPVP
jgi:hypothetical protein